MAKVEILGVGVDDITKTDLEAAILECVNQKKKQVFAYANVHAINTARHDSVFREFLNRAYVVYCDGEGVRLGARILGAKLPPKTVLTRWIWDLGSLFQEKDISTFLLGGRPETVAAAASHLGSRFSKLRLVGFHHGYFDWSGRENAAVVDTINRFAPNVLFVGFGIPKQELWIRQNSDRLNVNVIVPCGGMIHYLSGEIRKPPAWMSENGLEWLHRLAQDPRRLWRRYLWGNPVFMFNIFRDLVTRGRKR